MSVYPMVRALIPAFFIAAIVLAVAAGLSLSGAEPTIAADRPRFDSSRGVLLSSRQNLRVCVQPEASDPQGAAVGNVRAALARLNADTRFRAGAYDKPAWQVALNCPQPGRLLVSGQRHAKAGGSYATGPVTNNPSPFRLFVYVVPTSEIGRMFGSLPFHFAGQEVFCDNRECATVTTALYVDAATVRDETRLVPEIEQALGLRPAYPADPKSGNTPVKGK